MKALNALIALALASALEGCYAPEVGTVAAPNDMAIPTIEFGCNTGIGDGGTLPDQGTVSPPTRPTCDKWGVRGYNVFDANEKPGSGFHPDALNCANLICIPESGTYIEKSYCQIKPLNTVLGKIEYTAVTAGIMSVHFPLQMTVEYDDGLKSEIPATMNTWYQFQRIIGHDTAQPIRVTTTTSPAPRTPLHFDRLIYDKETRTVKREKCPGIPGVCELWVP